MNPALPRLHRPASLAFAFVWAAFVLSARVEAQTHHHPAVPSQPLPAGSTPASGSTAETSDSSPVSEMDHSTMAMPMDHGMQMSFGPISDTQDASGTAWQPSSTPMHAHHSMSGDWTFMTHYNAFVGYDHQSGPRGADQFNSINWLMLMATHRTPDDDLGFRGMFSLEPFTTTTKGYPLLFQSGEAYHGQPSIDRQHPHDFFMELSARYRYLLNPETVFSLYVAPSGEPALGPPAFPHRMSAMDNPAAPISHHWLDSSHISFGVLTAGIAQKTWQLEGSWFNGREPDEDRWDIEHPKLDSCSGRLSWNPDSEWSAQASYGYLKSPEELHPEEHVRRTTASIINLTTLPDGSHLATTFGWGRNDHGGSTNAYLIEPSYLAKSFTVFARGEYVEKNGEELGLLPPNRKIALKQVSVGMSHELVNGQPWQLALGGAVTYTFKPDDLNAAYGSRPMGVWIFLRLRPAAMEH